jgi:hypothetical protein
MPGRDPEMPKEGEMSKLKLALLFVIMSVISVPAMAGEAVVKRVPAGAVAFHFVADLSYITGELVGYIAFIEGVDSPLFTGEPSKDTAHFTVRISVLTPLPTPLPVETGSGIGVSILEAAGAQFTVYYNSDPGPRDWNVPATFSEGVPIAVFEESALLSTFSAGASYNVFSSWLVDSTPIHFNGQKIDFKKLVPNGVTTTNYTSPRFLGASFGGTSVAIGGNLRDK